MKGIILAGGGGKRLNPLTLAVNKQLLPVYDKPMIYYPLSTLMLAGIREILIISTPRDLHLFESLLGDGHQLGCEFTYAVQEKPEGLAKAFVIGKKFIGESDVCLILGDNLFHGAGLVKLLREQVNPSGGSILAAHVKNPSQYGVVTFDKNGRAHNLTEKPANPISNYAVPGIYFYENSVVQIAERVSPSKRGEYEITDINREYLRQGRLHVSILNRGIAWLDTGTFHSLSEASMFVRVIEERQSMKIGCIEEVAFRSRFIDSSQLSNLAARYEKSSYGDYLKEIIASAEN